jgi:hypothetical protein
MPEVVGGFGAHLAPRCPRKLTENPVFNAAPPSRPAAPMDSIVTIEPDPAVDAKHIVEAKELMKSRFVTKLASRGVPCVTSIEPHD